jgi:hypothetical protein
MTTTNTRIQEFILEATVTTDVYNPDTGITHYREFFDHEKFAELIVRECAEVAQMKTPDTEECEYTHLISEKIKEHFGVKE